MNVMDGRCRTLKHVRVVVVVVGLNSEFQTMGLVVDTPRVIVTLLTVENDLLVSVRLTESV